MSTPISDRRNLSDAKQTLNDRIAFLREVKNKSTELVSALIVNGKPSLGEKDSDDIVRKVDETIVDQFDSLNDQLNDLINEISDNLDTAISIVS